MLKRSYCRLVENREGLLVALLLLLGCGLRLAALGALPRGLNQDEASAGYEAWALLHSGMDRCGNTWPVLFTAWGSGQNVLMSYLDIPFVAVLGLSELSLRLPNALAGCLTLPVFWLLARQCRGKYFGITALLLLVINPWHIMASRWALESNLFPFFLLLGLWLCSVGKLRPWALCGAAAAFGLSLYAYGAAFFFLPLFLLVMLLWLRRDLLRRPAPYLTAALLFILLAAPITLCQVINTLGWEEQRILGVTLPRLTAGRQAATSVLGGASVPENLRDFLRILRLQNDGLPWNALPLRQGGILYIFGLPAAAVGFLASLFGRKDRTEEFPLRLALLCSLVCACLIRCNINRINMLWLPLIYFSAVGCHLILRPLEGWAVLPAAAVLACFGLFAQGYAAAFGGAGNVNFFPGLGEAVVSAQALQRGPVYITERVNQPYIFALFYTRTPPEEFVSTVEYTDFNAAFRRAERFSGFEFAEPGRCDILILYPYEAEKDQILGEYGDFVLCVRDRATDAGTGGS